MKKTYQLFSSAALVSAALVTLPLATNAADLDPPVQEAASKNHAYVSVFGGASFLRDADFTNSATTVATDFNTGFNVGGAVGYKFLDHNTAGFSPRLEFEFSYFDNGVGGINFSGNGPGAETVLSGSDVSGFTFFGNVFFDYETGTRLTPYVGGGVGFGRTDLNVAYNGLNLNLSDSDTNFAWHIGGGAKFAITDSISLFTDARYQQIIDAGSIRNIGAVPVPAGGGAGFFADNLSKVLVRAGLTFNF